MVETDEWLRRRIRAIYWKQWKKVKTRYRMVKALKLPEWKVHEMSNCRKGLESSGDAKQCTNKQNNGQTWVYLHV